MTVISLMPEDASPNLALRTVPVVPDAKGPVGLLVELDRQSEQPLYAQLEHRLRAVIRDGRLAAGSRPSSGSHAGSSPRSTTNLPPRATWIPARAPPSA